MKRKTTAAALAALCLVASLAGCATWTPDQTMAFLREGLTLAVTAYNTALELYEETQPSEEEQRAERARELAERQQRIEYYLAMAERFGVDIGNLGDILQKQDRPEPATAAALIAVEPDAVPPPLEALGIEPEPEAAP